jgi:hypothetical protein
MRVLRTIHRITEANSTKPRLWPLSLVIDEPIVAVKPATSPKKRGWDCRIIPR